MCFREKIEEVVAKIDRESFNESESLFANNTMSSFDLIWLTGLLEETFHVEIPLEEVSPENYSSPESIERLLIRCGAGQ